jgi:hypothetical protein
LKCICDYFKAIYYCFTIIKLNNSLKTAMPDTHTTDTQAVSPRKAANLTRHRVLARLYWLIAVTLPLLALVFLLSQSVTQLVLRAGLDALLVDRAAPISAWQHAVLLAAGLLAPLCMAYTLWQAGRCFAFFAEGQYFCGQAVASLRGLAAGMFTAGVVGVLLPTALGLLLSVGIAPGRRALVLSVGSQELMLLLFAAIVWQIAHVMRQAAALAEENAQFV